MNQQQEETKKQPTLREVYEAVYGKKVRFGCLYEDGDYDDDDYDDDDADCFCD